MWTRPLGGGWGVVGGHVGPRGPGKGPDVAGSGRGVAQQAVQTYSYRDGTGCSGDSGPRRALRRVKGIPDTLTLRLEACVPRGLDGRAVVVEQRLTRRDVARMLAAFDAGGGKPSRAGGA